MTVLLALQSCRGIHLCCWLYSHAGEYNCAVGSRVMQGNTTVLVAIQSSRRLCAVGFTVMQDIMAVLLALQEIKTVLSQAACLHPVKQTQKKCYYQSEDEVLKVQLILVFKVGK
jgi:hypothetical protein